MQVYVVHRIKNNARRHDVCVARARGSRGVNPNPCPNPNHGAVLICLGVGARDVTVPWLAFGLKLGLGLGLGVGLGLGLGLRLGLRGSPWVRVI